MRSVGSPPKLVLVRVGFAFVLALLLTLPLAAQELPVRTWSVRDGLIQSRVNAIFHDSNGYVWFSTWEGASRFDGRRFVNYGSREGLPNPLVWCVAEAPDGSIWFGTHGGGLARAATQSVLALAEPLGPRNPAPRVFTITFDSDGRMWIVTNSGLYRSASAQPEAVQFEHVLELGNAWEGRPCVDAHGQLWFVAANELVRCRGRDVQRFPLPTSAMGADLGEVRAVARRRSGGVWAAHLRSLHVVEFPEDGVRAPARRVEPIDFGPSTSLYDVCEDNSGRLWVATSRGLVRVDGGEKRWFTAAQGLPDDWIHALAREPQEGMWVGTHQGGAAWLPDSGVEHFSARSGLGDGHAVKLLALDTDRWLVPTEVAGVFLLANGRAQLVAGTERPPFDRIQYNLVRDEALGWWIGTGAGLFHADGPELDIARAEPWGEARGLPAAPILVLGRDPEGRVLVATSDGGVHAGHAREARFQRLPIPRLPAVVLDMVALPDGSSWLSEGRKLWRWQDERLEDIDPWPDSDDDSEPRVLRIDSRGWLWVGTRFGGVAFTREPTVARPRFERITARHGLASAAVFALAEDRAGALYLGTGRGVQRYRPVEGSLEVALVDDGLGGEWITDLALDARDDLWVATAHGVSRIRKNAPRAQAAPPRVRFTRCVVAGAELTLPAAGTFEVARIEIGAKDSRLAFEYVAVDPVRGQRFLYQTRLEGLDVDWSEPTRDLSARYGQLAAGPYRLAVRCVDPGASAMGESSSLRIDVVPPLWMRPWFLALALLAATGLCFAAHRLHLGRELALERVRTEIASDLHDDIGAGLAQIAIASELARRAPPAQAHDVLREVAELARNLRSSMSDLVWAVDPRHDSLADVVGRMRHFATDVIAGAGQTLEFHAPDERALARLLIAPDRRRNLFLLYKEAVTNVARHAAAAHVRIDLAIDARRVRLSIGDDGCGFDPQLPQTGQGLGNLRRRARELDAALSIDSAPGHGTRIVLDASV